MKPMNKHTPGPWAATTRQRSWDWVVFQASDPNTEICQMFHDGTDENLTGEANAHLIAAAVDLLAALDLLVDAIDEMQIAAATGNLNLVTDKMRAVLPLRTNARAAIARAKGKDA